MLPEDGPLRAKTYWSGTVLIMWCFNDICTHSSVFIFNNLVKYFIRPVKHCSNFIPHFIIVTIVSYFRFCITMICALPQTMGFSPFTIEQPIYGSCSELFKLAEWPIKGSQAECWSFGEFCSRLSHTLCRFTMLQDCWRSGFLCGARMDPLQQPLFICQQIATAHLSQLTNTVPDTACFCTLLALESTVGSISTLAYEMGTNCWPESFSVAYCMHIVQTKLMHKTQGHTKK
jgi:hypothetical protein